MSNIKPTKRQTELLNLLCRDYSLKVIDLEPCLYRRLNADYDFEISGTARKGQKITIYVWDIRSGCDSGARAIETVGNVLTNEQLKETLDLLSIKYGRN